MEAIEHLARRRARPQYARSVPEFATTHELVTLFGVNRETVARTFVEARVPGRRTAIGLYLRARVAHLLSTWNGRPIAYPSAPLLTAGQATAVLAEQGVEITSAYLRWLCSPSAARTVRTRPEAVRVGSVLRFTHASLGAYAADRRDHLYVKGRT